MIRLARRPRRAPKSSEGRAQLVPRHGLQSVRKGGAIVTINHRMHHDDLSGCLLAQQAAVGDQWTVVELHMLSNPRHRLIMAAIMIVVMAAAMMLMR
jgi:hypothetical protein